MKVWLSSWWW